MYTTEYTLTSNIEIPPPVVIKLKFDNLVFGKFGNQIEVCANISSFMRRDYSSVTTALTYEEFHAISPESQFW